VCASPKEQREEFMSLERWIRLIAGSFVTVSVVLSYVHSPYWLFFTLFVGVNLFQSALTRWCLMEEFLKKLGIRSGLAATPRPL
jgi:hypothetical protein